MFVKIVQKQNSIKRTAKDALDASRSAAILYSMEKKKNRYIFIVTPNLILMRHYIVIYNQGRKLNYVCATSLVHQRFL